MDAKPDTRSPTPHTDPHRDVRPDKPSRAAEYIAVLYVALLLCAPWLVRDSAYLMPPSNGIEIQVVNKVAALGTAAPAATAVRVDKSAR
jgi:hypothetical protein